MSLRSLVKRVLRCGGIDVRRVRAPRFGESPDLDLQSLLPLASPPVILDVGANVGQSVERFRALFPGALIHAFEPSPAVFATLSARYGGREGVRLWNLALGAKAGRATLHENEMSAMSSLLERGGDGWGEIVGGTDVAVGTIDGFVEDEGLERVDLLKADTQGSELQVLRGASRVLAEGRVRVVLCEMTFAELYREADRPDAIYAHLVDRGFALVGFHGWRHQRHLASWADALFVHRGYYREHLLPGIAASVTQPWE